MFLPSCCKLGAGSPRQQAERMRLPSLLRADAGGGRKELSVVGPESHHMMMAETGGEDNEDWFHGQRRNEKRDSFVLWFRLAATTLNFLAVCMVLVAYYDFFKEPKSICARPGLPVPSGTISEVLTFYRSSSDSMVRIVWAACLVMLCSFVLWANTDGLVGAREETPKEAAARERKKAFMYDPLKANMFILMGMAMTTLGVLAMPTARISICNASPGLEAESQIWWHSFAVELLMFISFAGACHGGINAYLQRRQISEEGEKFKDKFDRIPEHADENIFYGCETLAAVAGMFENILVLAVEVGGTICFVTMMRCDRHVNHFCEMKIEWPYDQNHPIYQTYWAAAVSGFYWETKALCLLLLGLLFRASRDLAGTMLQIAGNITWIVVGLIILIGRFGAAFCYYRAVTAMIPTPPEVSGACLGDQALQLWGCNVFHDTSTCSGH
eukprot:TRINITY_DN32083_c0_g1_i1.p1 TRINITY_DN32083_c0_g1~~TRINITY_DN32083_c0_g1_i1.p1  ORF type:complete len:442 (+),score=52.53 TRINITY_DN32083_c0_g1_i1:130-1455(+)